MVKTKPFKLRQRYILVPFGLNHDLKIVGDDSLIVPLRWGMEAEDFERELNQLFIKYGLIESPEDIYELP